MRVGLWWTWFRDSTFISGSVRVLLCNEALGTSSSLAVEGEAVKSVFSRFSRCSIVMSTEFAVFLPCTRRFSTLGLITFTPFHVPCHMTHRGGGARVPAQCEWHRVLNTFTSFDAPSRDVCGWSMHCACVV